MIYDLVIVSFRLLFFFLIASSHFFSCKDDFDKCYSLNLGTLGED